MQMYELKLLKSTEFLTSFRSNVRNKSKNRLDNYIQVLRQTTVFDGSKNI